MHDKRPVAIARCATASDVSDFKCSGTHSGEWLGHAATVRRFEDVDEIYIFQVRDGKLISAIGIEDNLSRLRQLELRP